MEPGSSQCPLTGQQAQTEIHKFPLNIRKQFLTLKATEHWHRWSREALSLKILKPAALLPCLSGSSENSCLTQVFHASQTPQKLSNTGNFMIMWRTWCRTNARLGLQRYEIIHLLCYGSCFQCWASGYPRARTTWGNTSGTPLLLPVCPILHPHIHIFQNF